MRTPQILNELLEICGWQGLFNYNQIKELSLTLQGNVIVEGDCLVLSIRECRRGSGELRTDIL